MSQFPLNPGQLTLADLRAWYFEPQQLELAESAIEDIERSAATVQKVLDKGRVVYGINTGFGLLANTRIPPEKLTDLQRRIVLSHSVGTGELMDDEVVRLMLLLKMLLQFQ